MVKRIEALTVCVNYADFLAETLPYNIRQFDHYLVVTSYDDHETKDLCERLGVECRQTDVMYYDGVFAKTRASEFGLGYLRRDDWVVHIDADVWLPPTTRQWIEWSRPDPNCIYGIDRCNCVGWEAWKEFISKPFEQHHQHHRGCLVLPPPFPLGARIALRDYGG